MKNLAYSYARAPASRRAVVAELCAESHHVGDLFNSKVFAPESCCASRLREVFRFAAENPCVLLFDEVDALAKRRGTPLEVGELDRVVIAFMQELEHASPEGFIVATCNLPQSLDDALWRRFDLAASFPRPSAKQLEAFARKRCKKLNFAPSKKLAPLAAKSGSYARAEQLIADEARRRALAKLK